MPHLTGLKNCELLASIKDVVARKQISQCLMDVGLDPRDTRTFNKYSLGMKQRLGLAAAFMEQPHVVLLDEPTNALDEEGIELLSSLVLKSRERGACIAIASHDALVLETIADKIYLMKEGALQPASSTAIPPVDQQCAGTQAEEAA
ncbi:ATP-binding cassette domain-containing protein [Adlercreutzia caecimuris]|uniref:ATP-binding cassette domain-containing protein n=2 Tax=Adlercreutzia caecimuris TaxID=671266 RepID=UPI003307472B